MTIPAQVHFCWIGRTVPWAYVFAVLSAAERGGLERVILHHTDQLLGGPELDALRGHAGVTLSLLDPAECLADVGRALGVGGALAALYGRLEQPVTRTDVLRACVLHRHGGIYLDLDTVTVATLRPLLNSRQFVSTEFVVWPDGVRRSRSPFVWARHLALDLFRKICRTLPDGWRVFRRVERFYARAVNNAAMGSEPGGKLLGAYLRAMLDVPPRREREPYAFGPDLLGTVVGRHRQDDVTVQPPSVFSPLPPEISEHWFRRQKGMIPQAALPAETRVVHWYASVRTTPRVLQITPDYVRSRQAEQPYSALVYANLPKFFQAA